LECKYDHNAVNLCWVEDAIKVIDNQEETYKLTSVFVSRVYDFLYGLHKQTLQPDGEFTSNLFEILNYYKHQS
jgi:hypothetical protein